MINWLKQCANWTGRFIDWLGQAALLWIALGVVPAVFVPSIALTSTLESLIRIAGMFLELLGLVTVAFGIRQTRELFDKPGLLSHARAWLAAFPSFRRSTRIVVGTGAFNIGGGGAVMAHGVASLGPTATVEERLAALERGLQTTSKAVYDLKKTMREEQREQAQALKTEREERQEGDKRTGGLLREAIAGGIHLETIGVFWLLLGIFFATASEEIIDCLSRLFS